MWVSGRARRGLYTLQKLTAWMIRHSAFPGRWAGEAGDWRGLAWLPPCRNTATVERCYVSVLGEKTFEIDLSSLLIAKGLPKKIKRIFTVNPASGALCVPQLQSPIDGSEPVIDRRPRRRL